MRVSQHSGCDQLNRASEQARRGIDESEVPSRHRLWVGESNSAKKSMSLPSDSSPRATEPKMHNLLIPNLLHRTGALFSIASRRFIQNHNPDSPNAGSLFRGLSAGNTKPFDVGADGSALRFRFQNCSVHGDFTSAGSALICGDLFCPDFRNPSTTRLRGERDFLNLPSKAFLLAYVRRDFFSGREGRHGND